MNDLVFKKEEFVDVIEKLVPSYQKEFVLNTLEQDEKYDYENDVKQLTGEVIPVGMIRKTSAKKVKNEKSILIEIKKEIFDFICTNSSKYKEERNKSTNTLEEIIKLIATAVGSTIDIATGLIIGAVTIILISILKITKNAWCSLNKLS